MSRDEAEGAIQAFWAVVQSMPDDIEVVKWKITESGAPQIALKALTDRGREFLRECFPEE